MGDHAFLSPSSTPISYECAAAPLRQFQQRNRIELLREIGTEFYGLTEVSSKDRLNKVLEDDTTMADEGTAFHTVFEVAVRDRITDKAKLVEMIHDQNDITDNTKDDIYIIDTFCQRVIETIEATEDCSWISLEHKVKVIGLPQFGFVDIPYHFDDRILHIEDLKTGYNPVQAENNKQLMTYAVGILDELGWDKFDKVVIKIIGVRWASNEWEISIKDLKKFKTEVMLPSFIAAYAINPKATAGDHCQYCSAKISCKAWQEKFEGTANEFFEVTDFTNHKNDKLVSLYKLCKQAENLLKFTLSQELLQRFEGFDIPMGVTRVSGRKMESWSDDEKSIVKAFKKKVPNKNDLYTQKLLTPKGMKALVGDDEAVDKLTKTVTYKPYLKL